MGGIETVERDFTSPFDPHVAEGNVLEVGDQVAARGLGLPTLSAATQARLRALIPDFGGVGNPVDITAVALRRAGMVSDVLDIVRSSGEVDLVLLQLSTNADPAASTMAEEIIAMGTRGGPPLLVGRFGDAGLAPRAMAHYAAADVHVFTWPEQLVDAAHALVACGRMPARPVEAG